MSGATFVEMPCVAMENDMRKDLRSYLKEIESLTSVVSREVDPRENVGTLVAQRRGPIRFENVKGYPGWTVVDGLVSTRRLMGIALGVEAGEVVPELARRLEAGPLMAVEVNDGPVKEKKILAAHDRPINLLEHLPVCVHSELDPCPYLGGAWNIVRDPDTGETNSAFCRTKVDGKSNPVMLVYSQHNRAIIQKYAERGQPAPWAMVLGHHPAVEMAVSSYRLEMPGYGEIDLAGRLLGEALELVPCETIDLRVPAYAEIVIEGFLHPDRLAPEGPFGDVANNYMPFETQQSVYEVSGLTMREDALYRHINATTYTDHQALTVINQAAVFQELKEQTGKNIIDVTRPPWGGYMMMLIQMRPEAEDDAQVVLQAASQFPSVKIIMVVDTDIDIYNAEDVLFALSTRINPSFHLEVRHELEGLFLDPSSEPDDSDVLKCTSGQLLIDATIPRSLDEHRRRNFLRARPRGDGRFLIGDFLS